MKETLSNEVSRRRYDVRCFRRLRDDGQCCGVWVMTRKTGYRGMFIHGDRDAIQPPEYTVEQLEDMAAGRVHFLPIEEITPEETGPVAQRGKDSMMTDGNHGIPEPSKLDKPAPRSSHGYAAEFLKDGGTIALSYDVDSESVRIIAKGYGKTATRLCELVPDGLEVDRRGLFVRDIEACVRALLDYRPFSGSNEVSRSYSAPEEPKPLLPPWESA